MMDPRAEIDEDLRDLTYKETSGNCVSPIKLIYYLLQIFLLVLGIGVTYYTGTIKVSFVSVVEGGQEDPVSPLLASLVNYALVIGVAMMVYALLGILAVGLKNRGLATFYIVLVIGAIFTILYLTWWMQRQLALINEDHSAVWDSIKGRSRGYLQAMVGCCGFAGPHDRASLPCPNQSRIGCFPVGRPSPLIEWARGCMLAGLTAVFCVGFLLAILNIFIMFVHEQPPKREPSFLA